jgi:class 3 adenylate cyclase
MPLFLDRHDIPGVTAVDLAIAHARDVQIEKQYGVRYITYWFDPERATAFCLAEGPDAVAVEAVHRDSHGLTASRIILVDPRSVGSFMGSILEPEVGEPFAHTAFRAILFTDIEGSTARTMRVGDAGAMRLLRAHDSIVRAALATHGGLEVKHTGDGIMASFASVASAVTFAITAQRAFRDHNDGNPVPLDVKIGISVGEPITDHNDDLFGASVQLAARLCDSAPAGEIAVSLVVRELCIGKRFHFQDCGQVQLKGVSEPTSLYCVSWRDG